MAGKVSNWILWCAAAAAAFQPHRQQQIKKMKIDGSCCCTKYHSLLFVWLFRCIEHVRYLVRDDEGRHCYLALLQLHRRRHRRFVIDRILNSIFFSEQDDRRQVRECGCCPTVDISMCSQSANIWKIDVCGVCKQDGDPMDDCHVRVGHSTREWNTIQPIPIYLSVYATRIDALMQLIYFSVKNW